jgi:hypothetical protein
MKIHNQKKSISGRNHLPQLPGRGVYEKPFRSKGELGEFVYK